MEDRRQYLVRFLRGCAGAADDGQLGVDQGRLLVNGDLMREAADEFETLITSSPVKPLLGIKFTDSSGARIVLDPNDCVFLYDRD